MVRLHDDAIPYGLTIINDLVVIEREDEDSLSGFIESIDDVIQTWAEQTFIEYCRKSEPLTAKP